MITVFREMLSRQRTQILSWGIAIGLLGAMLVSIYSSLVEQTEDLASFIGALPPALFAAFGMEDAMEFLTPAGFIGGEFFSFMPLILGILAISLGSGLLVTDEENGTLDLLMAHPISRTEMFLGRLLGLAASLAGVLGMGWLGLALGGRLTNFAIGTGALLLPFLSLFAVLMLFATMALLFSFLLPARRLAAGAAGFLLVLSFFLRTMADLDENFEALGTVLPLAYYQSSTAVNGLNGAWLAALLGVALLLALLAWWRFERRDLRVGGEGSGLTLGRLRALKR